MVNREDPPLSYSMTLIRVRTTSGGDLGVILPGGWNVHKTRIVLGRLHLSTILNPKGLPQDHLDSAQSKILMRKWTCSTLASDSAIWRPNIEFGQLYSHPLSTYCDTTNWALMMPSSLSTAILERALPCYVHWTEVSSCQCIHIEILHFICNGWPYLVIVS